MPKAHRDFPIASNTEYATYLGRFSTRIASYNKFIDSFNERFANIIAGAHDTSLVLLLTNTIGVATRALIEDLDKMEEKTLLGTLAAEDPAPAAVEVIHVADLAGVEVIHAVQVPGEVVLFVRPGGYLPREGN